MYKVVFKDLDNNVKQQAEFALLQDAEAWRDLQLSKKSWKVESPKNYSVEIVDITILKQLESNLNKRRIRRSFGESLIDKLSVSTDAKNLTSEQIDAMMSDTIIAKLREHLWAGNIQTFVDVLSASDVSSFFTTEEKQDIIDECENFIDGLGD